MHFLNVNFLNENNLMMSKSIKIRMVYMIMQLEIIPLSQYLEAFPQCADFRPAINLRENGILRNNGPRWLEYREIIEYSRDFQDLKRPFESTCIKGQ